jgi:hypothetical protein
MSSRKFREPLEPLRARRTWARDAALRRVGQVRRELDTLQAKQARLASLLTQQALAAQGAWANAPQPEAHLAAISWLAARQAERVVADGELAQCKARLAEAIAHWQRADAALDAVERQTRRDRAAHARAAQVRAQTDADADWLVRKESA